MTRSHLFALALPLWPVPLVLGYRPARESGPAVPAREAPPGPVLNPDDDARTIARKALKAYGGEKTFSRWRCGQIKYRTRGRILPPQPGEAVVEDTFQLPGHFKRVARSGPEGNRVTMVFVLNHGKGWTRAGDAPAKPTMNDFTTKGQHPLGAIRLAGFHRRRPDL
jgi:hypothetical protein